MSSRKSRRKTENPAMTLREECQAENKEFGLEAAQVQMDFIFKVLHEHGINSELWLREYLEACAENGGRTPPDFERFLPWNMGPTQKKRLSQESMFQLGGVDFVRSNDGSVFHVQKDGKRDKVDMGSLTGKEFEKLTGMR